MKKVNTKSVVSQYNFFLSTKYNLNLLILARIQIAYHYSNVSYMVTIYDLNVLPESYDYCVSDSHSSNPRQVEHAQAAETSRYYQNNNY